MKADRYADENARPFDPQWDTVLPSLRDYLTGLAESLQEAEIASPDVKRERRRKGPTLQKYRDAVQAVALDLFRAHLSDPRLEVGIGTGTPALQKMCSGRYGAGFLSKRTFFDAMQALKAAGMIEETTSYWHDPTGQEGHVRRYQATSALLEALRNAGASHAKLRRREGAECIILKGKKNKRTGKKPLVAYGDVAFANEARDNLRVINRMLLDHWADLALSDREVRRKLHEVAFVRGRTPAHPPDLTARTVYRVFNNSDWEQGGRFNGAWWIGCPSPLRPYILIDGKRTVEVDYSGLHAAMLFAQAGESIPADPYEKCVVHTGGPDERKLVKLTFNALLNAESVQQLGEVKGYSNDLTGRNWDDFKRFIVSSFPGFTEHFGSGVGLKLQRKDSDLAEAVMLKFAAMGYACLPVHDSFIVHHEMQDVLTNAMKAVFEDMFGVVGVTDFDIGIGEVVEGTGEPIDANVEDLLNPTGYQGRLQAFRAMREQA
ncbi:MAG: hypothetical protein AAFP87_07180 [Pseudomonadota bacterium]